MATQAPKMDLSTFTSLSLSAQVIHLRAINHNTAPMWLCAFHDAYFKYELGGLLFMPSEYVAVWHCLSAYRTEQMRMAPQELELIFSTCSPSGRTPNARPYPSISYTHS